MLGKSENLHRYPIIYRIHELLPTIYRELFKDIKAIN
jgi:hypothetical protein